MAAASKVQVFVPHRHVLGPGHLGQQIQEETQGERLAGAGLAPDGR
jgi:hypothetical protein